MTGHIYCATQIFILLPTRRFIAKIPFQSNPLKDHIQYGPLGSLSNRQTASSIFFIRKNRRCDVVIHVVKSVMSTDALVSVHQSDVVYVQASRLRKGGGDCHVAHV